MSLDISSSTTSRAYQTSPGTAVVCSGKEFTISFWIKSDNTSTSYQDILMLYDQSGGWAAERFHVRVLSAGLQALNLLGDEAQTVHSVSPGNQMSGSWNHILVVHYLDTTTYKVRFYVDNGAAINPAAARTWTEPPAVAEFDSLQLGNVKSAGDSNTYIAEVAYWNGANDSYAEQLAAGVPASSVGSPLMYWPLRNGQGGVPAVGPAGAALDDLDNGADWSDDHPTIVTASGHQYAGTSRQVAQSPAVSPSVPLC